MSEIIEIYEIAPLPLREKRAHKGSCGRLLVIGGSAGMSGAPYFSALSAYRMGCGLVKICSCAENRLILQTLLPEAIYSPMEEAPDTVNDYDAAVLGPGLGNTEEAGKVIRAVLEGCRVPLLLDADGLNFVAREHIDLKNVRCPLVITPHMGEMARLTGKTVEEILAAPAEICREYAAEHRLVCLLKDAETVVSDGEKVYRNHSGSPALATAGSGDSLAGILGALLADRMNPTEAAYTAAFLHGKCGNIAEKKLGQRSVMARDIAEAIPEVLTMLSRKEDRKWN